MKPIFFRSASDFRRWLQTHHETAPEVWVGFYKKECGKQGLTYTGGGRSGALLWLDRRHQETRRRAWVHTPLFVASVEVRLEHDQHQARPEPQASWRHAATRPRAFAKRDPARSGIYSFENRPKRFAPALDRRFRANKKAWAFFQAQPPGYRRLMTFMVMSAKQDEAKERCLARLIEASANQTRLT